MTNTEYFKKTVGYSRQTIETLFNTVGETQEQNRKLAGEVLEKAVYLPKEGKELAQRWLNSTKEVGETFREIVLKGHEQIEKYVNAA